MDGGQESRARSEKDVINNVTGSAAAVLDAQPDFILFQEVDTNGTRSHHIDESQILKEEAQRAFPDFLCSTFAQNYDSPYLFYPFSAPHGANRSGIMTFSRYAVASALRRSLPVEQGLMKLVDLDRCYSVNRIPLAHGDAELVLYNLHLSAYTSDGTIATSQLEMICSDMLAEYEKGNYCLAGGDFNKDLLGNSPEIFGIAAQEGDTWAQPIPEGVIPEGLTLVAPGGAASCRTASEPYQEQTTFRLTVDGFLISENIALIRAEVIDTAYRYSDHNPVLMDFLLK